MSTFDGYVPEIPNIRVDYFRLQPHRPPALAFFLSHVHSDHLSGLESFKGPFIYCSAATREILLRLERFPHRINFDKGVTEVRRQTYRHLQKLLKPVPLETPTHIELAPGNEVTVTLFPANHCAGAVMFLLESRGRSVLYTGDIRAEGWWVSQLARSPLLIPYVPAPHGAGITRLDCIYLDTTFATTSAPFRSFKSKAQGLAELLHKIVDYPSDTDFYLHAWTFGYEDVLEALANLLKTRIHLDRYRYSIYTALAKSSSGDNAGCYAPEGLAFAGFMVGNVKQEGILTREHRVRLHSCEQGVGCWAVDPVQGHHVVHIKPIVSRHDQCDILEAGLGGGQGDLDQFHELDLGDTKATEKLIAFCEQTIADKSAVSETKELLLDRLQCEKPSLSRLRLGAFLGQDEDASDSMKLHELAHLLQRRVQGQGVAAQDQSERFHDSLLPKLITFPYSRHSSYEELRLMVKTFRPRDIFPCTAPSLANLEESKCMSTLFGDVCIRGEDAAPLAFRWDEEMRSERRKQGEEFKLEQTRRDENIQRRPSQHHGAASAQRNADTQRGPVSESPSPSQEASHAAAASPIEPGHVSLPVANLQRSGSSNIRAFSERLGESASVARMQIRRRGFEAVVRRDWETVGLESTGTKRRRSEELF